MKIFVPKETTPGELRVAMIPSVVRKFAQNEFVVEVETGAGSSAFFADAEYVEAGASIASDFAAGCSGANVVATVRPLGSRAQGLPKECVAISYISPASDTETISAVASIASDFAALI